MRWGRGATRGRGLVPEMIFGKHGVGWIGRVGIVPDEILTLISHNEMTPLRNIIRNDLHNRFNIRLPLIPHNPQPYLNNVQNINRERSSNLINCSIKSRNLQSAPHQTRNGVNEKAERSSKWDRKGFASTISIAFVMLFISLSLNSRTG